MNETYLSDAEEHLRDLINAVAERYGINPTEVEHADICDGSDGCGEYIGGPQ